jgi:hypothetical protein
LHLESEKFADELAMLLVVHAPRTQAEALLLVNTALGLVSDEPLSDLPTGSVQDTVLAFLSLPLKGATS